MDDHDQDSPAHKRSEGLGGRLSKSASELSWTAPNAQAPTPRARSAAHHAPRTAGVVHRTQHFFSNLKHRWQRSKSKEKYLSGAPLSLAGAGGALASAQDSSGTDYAAESSERSTPAASPRHLARTHGDSASRRGSATPGPSTSATPPLAPQRSPDVLVVQDEQQRAREQNLRKFSFFQLKIHLKRGTNLAAMDKNGPYSGTSDPYVKFKSGGRLLHKSKIIHRDLNPRWDEVFTIPIEDPFVPVQIKVFDYDWGMQDDFMGSCQLDLTLLELGRSKDMVLKLFDPSHPTNDMGEIVLNTTLWPRTQEDKEQVSNYL